MVAHGSCLCKKVQYEVKLPFERFMYCHCSRCRKATGSPHAANGFVKPQAFRWTQGESEVRRYDLPEAKRFGLQFCSHCGSKVPHATRDGALMVIPAGSLDDDPGTKPQAVIFWGSRAPWFTDCSEMTRHDSVPG
ncbi:MAG TPA: GFA family protein [Micropepsaceae bacterium]|nr:GFA family protein [Micropepsaceae bacterium]